MQLTDIQIKNFRSIKDITLTLDDRTKIFIGINESGKTNVLDAISAINEDFDFEPDFDPKIPTSGNYQFQQPSIRYYFELSNNEKEQLFFDYFGENPALLPFDIRKIDLKRLPKKLIGGSSFEVYLKNEEKNEKRYYSLVEWYLSEKDGIYKNLNNADKQLIVKYSNGEKIDITEMNYFHLNKNEIGNWEDISAEIEEISLKQILKKFASYICDYMADNLPNVIYWEYDDSLLLPDKIDIKEFKKDPNISKPLKNIFNLANIIDIQERIENDYRHESAFHNLKKVLSKAATKHLRNTWKDYDDIEIRFEERSGKLSVLVEDKTNLYSFKQRSDGFKRFISFLFLLSAEHKNGELPKNTIILMDEPDMSLHPSGIRYLLDEIIRISHNNYCFISTHSIFMINRDNIKCHYIVEKFEEDTLIRQATIENFSEEEVLYQALGFSMFDIFRPKNLFFEGWSDKEIFKLLLKQFEKNNKKYNKLNEFGICWSSGVNKICQIIRPLLWDNKRYFQIISDYDPPAISEQKQFKKEFPETDSEFNTYSDFSRRRLKYITLEDLLPTKLIVSFFNEHLKSTIDSPDQLFKKDDISKHGIIKSWDSFCAKNYKNRKNKLTSGYKSKLPEFVEKRVNEIKEDSEKFETEFSFFNTYIENLYKKLFK